MSEVTLGKIYESLQSVNEELNAIKKDQKGYNYNFRGIDSVLNAIGPLFKKFGIITRRVNAEIINFPDYVDKKGNKVNHFLLKATYMFTSTIDGSEIFSVGFGEGMDGQDKAIGCATSNAYKYVIFEMFNIATEEQIDSDQKTAIENKVDAPEKTDKKPVSKPTASFRNKPAEKVEEPSDEL